MAKLIFLAFILFHTTLALATDVNDSINAGTITSTEIPKDAPKFEDFPADTAFQGKPATPILNTPDFKNMRTRIKEGAKTGPNFAGHYTLILVGCGGGAICLAAIADAKTGKLSRSSLLESIDFTNVELESEDYIEYRKDSNLIRVIGGVNEDSDKRGISYFVWKDNKLTRIRFVHHPYNFN